MGFPKHKDLQLDPAVDLKEQAPVQHEGLPLQRASSEAVCLGNRSEGRWGLGTGRDPGKGIVFSHIKEKKRKVGTGDLVTTSPNGNCDLVGGATQTHIECGGLNGSGSHRLTESGSTRRCGLAGVDVVLLEKVCHWGWTLRFQKLKPGPVSFSSCCLWM